MQTWPERSLTPATRRVLGALVMMSLTGLAHAQVLRVDPSVNFRLTYTDNVRADRDSRRSDVVGQVTPAVAIARDSHRINGRLNARLQNTFRSTGPGRSTSSLGLQGFARVEAVEDRFFIDLDAAVRRSNLSLFSGRADDDFLDTGRRSETRTYAVAPRLEFRLGTVANGRLRYQARWLDSGSRAIGAQRLDRWDANVENQTALDRLGWGLSYSRIDSTFSDRAIRDVTQETARANLSYRVTPQFRVRGGVGRERNDFGGPRVRTSDIASGGFDWRPTPRTTIAGSVEDRFFGTGYGLSLNHRRPRSNWLLSYGRDVSSSLRRFGSVFQDPFFLEFFNDPSFVAQFPDPVEREDEVRQLLGVTGDTFISSAHFVDRRLRAAVSLIGARNTLTFSALRSDHTRLSETTGLRIGDDFRDANTVRRTALSVSYRHRLSGRSSLSASLTRSRSERDGPSAQEIRRWIAGLGYSARLGPKSVGGLSYRFQNADGAAKFRENVLSATLGLRF